MTVFLAHKNLLPPRAGLQRRGQNSSRHSVSGTDVISSSPASVGFGPGHLHFPVSSLGKHMAGALASCWVGERGCCPGQRVPGLSLGSPRSTLHPSPSCSIDSIAWSPLPSGFCWAWPMGRAHWDRRIEGRGVEGVFIHLPGWPPPFTEVPSSCHSPALPSPLLSPGLGW